MNKKYIPSYGKRVDLKFDFLPMEEVDTKLKCDHHGVVPFKTLIRGNDFPEELECPECVEKLRIIKEKQDKIREIVENKRTACIPERFFQSDFESYLPCNENAKENKEICRLYSEHFKNDVLPKGTSIIFSGKVGTGKTHLACAIANELIKNNTKPLYINASRLIASIKDAWNFNKFSESELIKNYLSPDLLIIDEIGVQHKTQANKLIMIDVLNARYEKMKPSIIISNLNVEEMKDYLDDRVIDRLKDNKGFVLGFEWDSFRKT